METLIQISDTHLSPTYGWFHGNFLAAAHEINALSPDLVVNTGDVALSAPDHPDDLPFAAWAHDAIGAKVRFLPGNHDIGEEPGGAILNQPVSEDLLGRYQDSLGADRWLVKLGDWRLIGFNTQILGSGLTVETVQDVWLDSVLSSAHGGPIGIFLHKPLFLASPDETPHQEWTVSGEVRDELLRRFKAAGVRFIASGHMHQYKDAEVDGIRTLWAPSTAYLPTRPQAGTEIVLGYLVYRFDGPGFSVELCQTEGAEPLTFYDFFDPKVHRGLKDVPPAPPDAAETWHAAK